jgi:transposase
MEGKKWMFHRDNAPAHTSLLIREFLAKNETTIVPQPLFSSELDPADSFLFPKLKSTLKGQRFELTEETEENLVTELRLIKKKIQDCFQKWKKRLERCIKSGGESFEGDKTD